MSTFRPTDQYVSVGATRARYWQVGEAGSTIVLLHGIVRFVEDWLPNLEALARHHRVYAVDLVGFGRSDKPETPYSIDDLVDFARGFIDAIGVKRAHLIGHSLGGGIALSLAYLYPDLVDHLVLVANAGFGREVHWGFRLASLPVVGELVTRPNRPLVARALKTVFYDPALVTDELVEESYQMAILPGAQAAFLKTIRASITWRGIHADLLNAARQALPQVTAPTLIVWGQQDPVLPVAHAQVGVDHLANTRLHIFDRCGHFPQFEHPPAFNALVAEFLAPALISEPGKQPSVAISGP